MMRKNSRKSPLGVFLFGLGYCAFNGFLQAHCILTTSAPTGDFTFVIGKFTGLLSYLVLIN